MTNNTNAKTNFKQEENAYILYMMLGSLFHKCYCRNTVMADTLYLYYKDMKERQQETMENKILQEAEHMLGEKAGELEHLNCEAFIARGPRGLLLCFDTGFDRIEAQVWEDGTFRMRLVDRKRNVLRTTEKKAKKEAEREAEKTAKKTA